MAEENIALRDPINIEFLLIGNQHEYLAGFFLGQYYYYFEKKDKEKATINLQNVKKIYSHFSDSQRKEFKKLEKILAGDKMDLILIAEEFFNGTLKQMKIEEIKKLQN